MITVIFPGGAFGSTVEYALRNFSNELQSVQAKVLDNGSMHSYKKEFHSLTIDQLTQVDSWTIATTVYPGFDYLDPVTTIQKIKDKLSTQQKVILIQFSTVDQVYRNCLFAYYKIPRHIDHVLKNKPHVWNPKYNCVADMQTYELREALSFSMDHAENYLQAAQAGNTNWLYITPDDILYNFKNTMITMLDHCNLTLDSQCDIDKFYIEWFEKQQYIVTEFQTIQLIIKSLQDQPVQWSPLSIMGEAIVQHILRTQGQEIACHGLDQFPATTQELKSILINHKEYNEHQNF